MAGTCILKPRLNFISVVNHMHIEQSNFPPEKVVSFVLHGQISFSTAARTLLLCTHAKRCQSPLHQ